jgi:hypothetical protein
MDIPLHNLHSRKPFVQASPRRPSHSRSTPGIYQPCPPLTNRNSFRGTARVEECRILSQHSASSKKRTLILSLFPPLLSSTTTFSDMQGISYRTVVIRDSHPSSRSTAPPPNSLFISLPHVIPPFPALASSLPVLASSFPGLASSPSGSLLYSLIQPPILLSLPRLFQRRWAA